MISDILYLGRIESNMSNEEFDAIEEKINSIDRKLDILLDKLDYEDYVNFIKQDRYLSSYDTLVAYTDLNIFPRSLIAFLTDDLYNKIMEVVQKKIDSLN
jgi:hypothetical protein